MIRIADKQREPGPGMPVSTWRLRADAWEFLRFAVKRLALEGEARDAVANAEEIRRNLRALETIELYWAGFGQRYVRRIGELIEQGDPAGALDRIGRVVHRLRRTSVPGATEPTADEIERFGAALAEVRAFFGADR